MAIIEGNGGSNQDSGEYGKILRRVGFFKSVPKKARPP
jgi:hypothetical protein